MGDDSGRVPAWLVPALAGLTAVVAGLALLDWAVAAEFLSRTVAGYVPMSPWTAVSLLLAAAALWLSDRAHRGRLWRLGASASGLLLVALASAFLFQAAARVDLGIDNLLFPRAILQPGLPYAGRIAPNAALSLLAMGAASLLLTWGRGRAAAVVGQVLALAAGLIALLALIGYAYGVRGLYFLVGATRMAPSTAVAIMMAATGFFLLRPGHGPAGVATAPDLGGIAVRRLLPLIVVLPLVLGRLQLAGERADLWGPRLGAALNAIAAMMMLGVAVWAGGAILGRLDRRRSEAEAARGRLLWRERTARAAAERQARAELALRRAAEAVSAALTIEDVVPRIAESALEATDSDGVVVKRVLADEDAVEVIAVAGSTVPRVGSRGPYHGSFTETTLVHGRVEAVPVIAESGAPFSPGLLEVCGRCRAAVVPLVAGGTPIGALALVRRPERAPYRDDELARAHVFGDLAALAFHKAQLLEEAQRSRDEVLHAAEARARLVRGFSHDLKNPLGAAAGQIALLEEGVAGELEPAQREALSRARAAIAAAVDLIDDLVELVRAEAGQLSIEPREVDLHRVAAEMAEGFRPQAERRRITLHVEAAGPQPAAYTDPARVRQVLGNLLSNAVKYTPEGGRITVRTAERTGGGAPGPGVWHAVDVENTGPGIPPDKRELIFQEFARLEPGDTRGKGLGLAISRQVARALGGDLTVESAPGRGATFTLWIPTAAGQRRAERAA